MTHGYTYVVILHEGRRDHKFHSRFIYTDPDRARGDAYIDILNEWCDEPGETVDIEWSNFEHSKEDGYDYQLGLCPYDPISVVISRREIV